MNNLAQRSFPDFRPPIVLPAIQELIVFYGSSSLVTQAVTYLLHNLVMPQLRRLRLPRTIQQHIPTPFLGDLATRSPLIEDLSLNLSGLPHDSLVETLTMLPGLKRLVICDASDGGTNATVQRLFTSLVQQRREPPFPFQAEMQLKECHLWDDGKGAVLVDFVRQLLDLGTGHFKRLEIGYTWGWTDWAADILAEFNARGL
ncbi:hypothetical protein DFH06DRAFT_1246831, partial [Mycena polygramma]